MPEVVYPRDGMLSCCVPARPWYTEVRHFADDEVIYADHGYHHYGPEVEVQTSDPFMGMTDEAETIIR